VYPCVVAVHSGRPQSCGVTEHPKLGVTADEWSVLKLVGDGHNRHIRSFEIKFGEVENMQIGWLDPVNWVADTTKGASQKVGEHASSLSLDFCGARFLVGGDATEVAGLSAGKGDLVRCEKAQGQFQWYVNGESIPHKQGANSNCISRLSHYIPAFSGKGQWWITKVELDP